MFVFRRACRASICFACSVGFPENVTSTSALQPHSSSMLLEDNINGPELVRTDFLCENDEGATDDEGTTPKALTTAE